MTKNLRSLRTETPTANLELDTALIRYAEVEMGAVSDDKHIYPFVDFAKPQLKI